MNPLEQELLKTTAWHSAFPELKPDLAMREPRVETPVCLALRPASFGRDAS